jgi:hypothetical protein
MGRRNKRTEFDDSAMMNNRTYGQYLNRLTELSISMFEWKNLPDTIDPRFLELTLFHDGQAVFFKDEELDYLALQVATNGQFDVYRIPVNRRAYAVNGYQRDLNNKDSVIIYNNYLHCNSILDVKQFARRLYNLDRIIDVNANAQKTPVLVQGTEQQRLTLINLYKEYDGNAPVIFGDKNLDINSLKAISTQAPYVADKIYQLKTQIWNEALTYLGISNINVQKKERLISDEVTRNQGGTIASRYSRLESRREACRKINNMFGLDIWCDYREDFQEVDKVEVKSETFGTDTTGEVGNE